MNWTRGRIIGRGSSAAVSIATDDRTGKVFAVKSADVSKSELLRREQGNSLYVDVSSNCSV
ncbi:hypothetical protein Patl1_09971 [Pistacia atlantica]|uniref:Uncharacterized protein n=1 Tax=Pistacia atlantica TaxID=434234 RepID=A0ACC1A8V8_9ROSI|nr:hypothetical protein Patl1_09971 [Pistacia atlantica]